jgi:acetolactate synthase I/II/III large subunit
MSRKSHDLPITARRNFLKGAALTGAAALTPAVTANAQLMAPQPPLTAAMPGPKLLAVETTPPANDPVTQTSSGGEFMADVLQTLHRSLMALTATMVVAFPCAAQPTDTSQQPIASSDEVRPTDTTQGR